MVRVRNLVVVIALAGVGPFATAAPPAPGVYTVEPPAQIKVLLTRLKERDRPTEAIRSLAARDDAAPYLRMAQTKAADKRVQRDLTEALEGIEARAYERNLRRAAWWAKTRRFDLYTEFLSGCRERDAAEVTDWLAPETRDILVDAAEQLGTKNRTPSFTFKGIRFTDLSGEEVTVPQKPILGAALVRAGDCTFEMWGKFGMMVAVRGRFSDPLTPFKQRIGTIGEWTNSNLLVNSSIPLARCENTLVVCAGDIELVGAVRDAVIIAGGSIRSGEGNTSINSSFLCAGGVIELYRTRIGNNIVHAGGSVTLAGKPFPHENVKEKQKALPFGVRFVSPGDFGLEVAAQNGGIQIMGITSDSPFAKFGVKDADVIVSIDGVEAKSILSFSHQLRQGVLRESVILRIRRGSERITRIVFLDDIPLPTAPAPRVAGR
jgi:hypothetical protein